MTLKASEILIPKLIGAVADGGAPAAACAWQVEVVDDAEKFRALRPAWDALVERAGLEHPFLCHDWLYTWWESFGDGRELHLVLIRHGGELQAIAPLMLGRGALYGLPVRRLGSLYSAHTPRGGVIVARDADQAVYTHLFEHLESVAHRWDVIELCELTDDSPVARRLAAAAAAAGFIADRWDAGASPYVPIAGRWQDYERRLSGNLRSNLRNRFNRLARHGAVDVETVASIEGLGAALDEGYRLEAAAWKYAAGSAIAANAALRRFYTRLAERMAARGWLQLQFLRVKGRRIAFNYSLFHANRHYLLKPGYDPEFSWCSPGMLLAGQVLRIGFERGWSEYDFLGEAERWKQVWTPHVRRQHWLYLFPATRYSRFLHRLKFRFVPWVRGRDRSTGGRNGDLGQ